MMLLNVLTTVFTEFVLSVLKNRSIFAKPVRLFQRQDLLLCRTPSIVYQLNKGKAVANP